MCTEPLRARPPVPSGYRKSPIAGITIPSCTTRQRREIRDLLKRCGLPTAFVTDQHAVLLERAGIACEYGRRLDATLRAVSGGAAQRFDRRPTGDRAMHLNPVCSHFNNQLKAAMAAVHRLSDHACSPRTIQLGDRRPVIVIDPPPADGFIQGALRRRERVGHVIRTVMVATFHGCLLEWEAIEPLSHRSRHHA